jgi:creatinine amidohydrolase/Fe(II)-dependent formamide hydrolase-like protein
MKKLNLVLLSLLTIYSLAAPLAVGQGGSPRANTKKSGKTSAVPTSTSDSPVLMEQMTTTEVRDAIGAGKSMVLIFNGSTEASGPALALGKHVYRARYLGERIARELGNALVAPVMPFAPLTDEMRFPGSINLSPEIFSAVNEAIVGSMVMAGFKYIVLLGDHDGNQKPLEALASELDEKYRSQGVRVLYSSDAYAKSNQEIEDYLKEHGFPPSRHAGVADTSLLWAVDAKYVRPDKLAVGARVPPAGSPLALGSIGLEGDPRRSSPELGKMFLDWKVKNAVAEIRKLILKMK